MFKKLRQLKKALELIEKEEELLNALPEVKGDGKAVFFSEGTQEDYDEYVKEQSGWAKVFKKLLHD
jgi:hypothetical protein